MEEFLYRKKWHQYDKLEYLQIGQLAVAPFIAAQTAVVKTEGGKKVGKHVHNGTSSFFTEKTLEF